MGYIFMIGNAVPKFHKEELRLRAWWEVMAGVVDDEGTGQLRYSCNL